jgi:hypothetical protein
MSSKKKIIIIEDDECKTDLSDNSDKSSKTIQDSVNKKDTIENKITIEEIKKIICDNDYVKKCVSNSNKDIHSLSYLFDDMDLSQSDNIKVGHGLEKVLCQIISKLPNLKNIKSYSKTVKGEKEKDHLFLDEEKKIVYYSELKSNLNLDTEKSKITIKKCLKIKEDLKKIYPDYIIKMSLVGLRYCNKNDIPSVIRKKYENLSDNLIGINDYFTLLGLNFIFTHNDEYKETLQFLIKKMFKLNDDEE